MPRSIPVSSFLCPAGAPERPSSRRPTHGRTLECTVRVFCPLACSLNSCRGRCESPVSPILLLLFFYCRPRDKPPLACSRTTNTRRGTALSAAPEWPRAAFCFWPGWLRAPRRSTLAWHRRARLRWTSAHALSLRPAAAGARPPSRAHLLTSAPRPAASARTRTRPVASRAAASVSTRACSPRACAAAQSSRGAAGALMVRPPRRSRRERATKPAPASRTPSARPRARSATPSATRTSTAWPHATRGSAPALSSS